MSRNRSIGWLEVGALVTVYLVWGSTNLGIRIAVRDFPPFMMAGIRFLIAGGALYSILRVLGIPSPSPKEWLNSALLGALFLLIGNGAVTVAELSVPSGLTCLLSGTMPLWAAVFNRLSGYRSSWREIFGVLIGFCGLIFLNLGSSMSANRFGTLLVLCAAIFWALGMILGRRLTLPQGIMASAAQMLSGGTMLLCASGLSGEHLTMLPGKSSTLAIMYLTLFGSLVGYCAFTIVLTRMPQGLATSYAYVNPLVAVFIGWKFAGEPVTPSMLWAGVAILIGVAAITMGQGRSTSDSGIKLPELTVDSEREVAASA